MNNTEYAGFWIRFGAMFIDGILFLLVTAPLLTMIYGSGYWSNTEFLMGVWDAVLNYLFPIVAVLAFWFYKSATPGKMAVRVYIADANTGGRPSAGQFVGRYIAYILSALPLALGYIWVAFDKRKQGWHDKLAGTVVLKRGVQEQETLQAE